MQHNAALAVDSSMQHNAALAVDSSMQHNAALAADSSMQHNAALAVDSSMQHNAALAVDSTLARVYEWFGDSHNNMRSHLLVHQAKVGANTRLAAVDEGTPHDAPHSVFQVCTPVCVRAQANVSSPSIMLR
jgi:hypothetical protein